MSIYAKLSPADQLLVNTLLQNPTGMGQAQQIALAKALADSLELPESSAITSKLFYNDQHAIRVSGVISMINEMVVLPVQYVENLTRDFYCWRCDIAFGVQPMLNDSKESGLNEFLGLTTHISPETIAVINQTPGLTVTLAGFKRLIAAVQD